MKFSIIRLVVVIAALMSIPVAAQGALIAQYNFDGNSLANSASASYSPLTVIGVPPDLSGNVYNSDGNNSNYLEVAPAVGGAATYTVSVWVWTDVADQGGFKGIFANADSPSDNNSWQMDSHNGVFRLVGKDSGADNFGAVIPGVWNNLILTKEQPGDLGKLYLNGVLVNADIGANPGGLQEFRIGINRNSDNSFLGLIDNVQIWNTLEDPAAIYAAGHGIPEPATGALALLALGALARRRRIA